MKDSAALPQGILSVSPLELLLALFGFRRVYLMRPSEELSGFPIGSVLDVAPGAVQRYIQKNTHNQLLSAVCECKDIDYK